MNDGLTGTEGLLLRS